MIFVVLVSALILGGIFTNLPLDQYYTNMQVYQYIWKSFILIDNPGANTLPNVFNNFPVNGPMWTLAYEVKMYISLALIWFVCSLFKRNNIIFKYSIFAITLLLIVSDLYFNTYIYTEKWIFRLGCMFFIGGSFWLLKDKIVVSHKIFILILAIICVSFLSHNRLLLNLVYNVTLVYVVLYLAYVPTGVIRKYNLIGDYSYGIYIGHGPIQRSIIALTPAITPIMLSIVSLIVSIIFAIFSWHTIEKKAKMAKTIVTK